MNGWQEDVLARLQLATHEKEVFGVAEWVAQKLGFERCAYLMSAPLPFAQPKTFSINSFPRPWQERYAQAGYLKVDPTIHHCQRSDLAVVWSDEFFANAPEVWDHARSHGLCIGWAQGTQTAAGPRGILTLVRTSGELTAVELRRSEHLMSFATKAIHEAMLRTSASQLGWKAAPSLTVREIETLKWAADGKTSADIAKIIGLSENTIKFHIKNAIAKLQVANKTAAVAKAAMLGWLR